MDIVRLGICIDNVDPKGAGRIRYNEVGGSKELDSKYEKWGKDDKFAAMPFLPININFIPEIGQAVKIISYTSNNVFVNQEYIAGPFTTAHNFNSQNYEQQIPFLTYGSAAQTPPDVIKENGDLVKKKTKGSTPKTNHYGISGKYGSDILFTDNGVQIRGGKYKSKEIATPSENKELINFPILSEKFNKLTLKKYPYKMELKDEEVISNKILIADLKYIVEYDIDDLETPTTINFYVYKVISKYEDIFKTNSFNKETIEDLTLYPNNVKLINIDNTTTTPTFIVTVPPISGAMSSELRCTISDLELYGIEKFEPRIPNNGLHPFFVRPSLMFKNKLTPSTANFLDDINITGIIKGCGLFFSSDSVEPPIVTKKTIEKKLKITDKKLEQTFGSITSDKVYLLSTDTNTPNGPGINFKDLDPYEYTQEDFLEKIEPHTFSTVRGESLINVIRAVVNLTISHAHNINKPLVQSDPNFGKLMELLKTLEDDILNKSIRIN